LFTLLLVCFGVAGLLIYNKHPQPSRLASKYRDLYLLSVLLLAVGVFLFNEGEKVFAITFILPSLYGALFAGGSLYNCLSAHANEKEEDYLHLRSLLIKAYLVSFIFGLVIANKG
jgi:hypothetical protein